MPEPIENSFEIALSGTPNMYTVSARGPGVLTKAVPFEWPPSELDDLAATLLRLESGFELSLEFIQEFGGVLYQALFPDEIDDAYQRLDGKGDPFRLRLIIHPPELARLPWEFLYDEQSGSTGWLSIRHKQPLVRSVPNTDIAEPLAGQGPLRVLFVGANPEGTIRLDIEEDERRLREGLAPLIEQGLVKLLDPQMDLTPDSLRDRIRLDEPHVLHYSGHATFDSAAGEGSLILEGDSGQQPLSGGKLALALRDRSVRLVVLSACRTAEISETQPFVGVAQQLANAANLSAVIAMQFPIGDANAITFNKEFYQALADRYPIDQAMSEARLAIWQRTDPMGNDRVLVDWATPVLFMLGHSGSLWEENGMADEKKDGQGKKQGGMSISIGGNVGGDVTVAEGDIVGGDKITTGDIVDSKGVAIGRGASAEVIEQSFADILKKIEVLPSISADELARARDELDKLKGEVVKGDNVSKRFIKKRLRNLAHMAPDILDIATATLINPAAGVGMVVRKLAEKARADAGLDAV